MVIRFAIAAIVLWCNLVVTIPVTAQQDSSHRDTVAGHTPTPTGSPVVFNDDTLFHIMAQLGPFTPSDRAEALSGRMSRLSSDPLASLDSIVVVETENGSEISSGGFMLMVVSNADAGAAGRPRQELAAEFRSRIWTALDIKIRSTSLTSILQGVLFALLATLALVIAFRLINKTFPRLYAKIDSWKSSKISSLRIQKLEILSADRIGALLLMISKTARIILTAVLLYIYIPLLFSFFPWTRGFAAKLFGFILSPVHSVWTAFTSYLPNIFFIAVIIVVAWYISRFIRWIAMEIERGTLSLPGFYPEWASPTYKLLRFVVFAFSLVVIFPYLPGSGSLAFQGVGVFLGLLLSLGSASAISNIIAGVVLTYMRAFSIGDRVRIADTFGDVMEKTLLVTRIRTIKNVDVTVPNGLVLGSHLVNFSSAIKGRGLILHTTVTIGYNSPWGKVHDLLITAAESTENVLKEPKPFVLQTSLSDYYVNYEINVYTDKPHDMAKTYSDLHSKIQDTFNAAGVEIMSAHYTSVRDGNRTTIPEKYLPDSYTPPPFKIVPLPEPFGKRGGREEGVKS